MDQRVKALWTAALRSGQFTQGNGYLRTEDDKMCCLGVLCELAVAEGVIPEPHAYEHGRGEYRYAAVDGDLHTLYPPPAVVEWAGLPDRNPLVIEEGDSEDDIGDGDGDLRTLASRNDAGATFAQIADLIDAHL